jgi:DNA-binding protein HU-beta
MNKAGIIDKVHATLGMKKADAERAVDTMIDSIVSGLKSGDEVSIAGLGIFATKARAAREGRNPRTGETIRIAATRTAKFRPAKGLKDAIR